MADIKEKIRKTKLGGLNPNARSVKIKNYYTGEEIYFDSCADCQRYFNEANHNFITRRCNHITHCLYKAEWYIAYTDEDYDLTCTIGKNNRKQVPIEVTKMSTGEKRNFPSFSAAKRAYN